MFIHVSRKSGRDLTKMQDAKYVTHAAIQPTHSPSWEELLMIEVKEEDSDDEGLCKLKTNKKKPC